MSASQFRNYKRQLLKKREKNFFFSQWGGVILRNSDKSGNLLEFKTGLDFKNHNTSLWIHLPLLIFRDSHSGNFFPIWTCEECSCMKGLSSLIMTQVRADLKTQRCVHSRMASSIVGENWFRRWPRLDLQSIRC